ncbi:MAG: hypothetical protein WBM98_17785 [Maribacter sp.]|uniref:hypothetical protein n=1 Tax=Maribacter sp. TaxID=1897614 RepID=UPI003C75C99E
MKISRFYTVSFVLILYTSAIPMYGQARVTVRQNGPNTELYFNTTVKAPTYDEVIGSPYLYEDFVPARVNEIEVTHFIRFNVFDNSIEYKNEAGEIYSMVKPNDYNIELLDGSNKVYETHDYNDDKKEVGNTFFEKILTNGDYGLYHREIIEYTPVKMAKNSFETNRPAKFINTKGTFYFVDYDTEGQVLIKLPNREKHLLKLFNEHAAEVKEILKKEGLHIDREKDLIRILDFYFTLKSS